MKILFLGEIYGNSGPDNVHKKLLENWAASDIIYIPQAKSQIIKIIKSIWIGIRCDVVFSPGSSWIEIIAHVVLGIMKKPVICFNHGYVPYENVINNLGLSKTKIKAIKWHMKRATRIITNSKLQMAFVVRELPEVRCKVCYATLGIDEFTISNRNDSRNKGEYVIAVSGGTRPIKGNDVVARAVALLRTEGLNCRLDVFGRRYAENFELDEAIKQANGRYVGQIAQNKFLEALEGVDVFVMNSRHEPFGLSALEALQAGDSLLLSKNCGVLEVMSPTDCDVVTDCEDAEEVAGKIRYLLRKPNASRLFESIDFQAHSWSKCAERIREEMLRAARNRETSK